MHSSRMRTTHSSSHWGGGLHQASPSVMAFWCGGLLLWPSAPPSRHPPKSRHPPGIRHPFPRSRPPWRPAARHAGILPAMHAGIAPPPLLTESQMPVKTLPCPNFVAGGNNGSLSLSLSLCNVYITKHSIETHCSWSRSLSLSQPRSCAVCMSHYPWNGTK